MALWSAVWNDRFIAKPTETAGSLGGADAASNSLRAVWSRSRETVEGRLENLERAAALAVEGRLDAEARLAAEADAHKLAGALGTFGFPQASDLAREAELE